MLFYGQRIAPFTLLKVIQDCKNNYRKDVADFVYQQNIYTNTHSLVENQYCS